MKQLNGIKNIYHMKKIAFNMTSASHGGGFKTYNDNILIRLIGQKNKKNKYYIFTNDSDVKNNVNENVNLIYVSSFFSKMIPRILWMQFILPIYLVFMRIDVFFSPMNIMPILLRITKIKKILVIHSNLPWLFPNDVPGGKIKLFVQKLLTNKSIEIADKIIVDSKNAKKELSGIFEKINNKILTIYLGVDFDSFNNNLDDSDLNNIEEISTPFFLTISSAVRYHCLIELIIAYEKLCDDYNNMPNYLIISKKLDHRYFDKINKKIKSSRFSNKIKLIENIDSDKIPVLYRNASLYIFSSYCEVFGLTNLEAMSCGVPVITSKRSSIPEICGSAAIYFNPDDPDDIKNTIIKLHFNEKLKNIMVQNGYNHVKKYSWDQTFKETMNSINSIIHD